MGIDGCPAGWLAVALSEDGRSWAADVYEDPDRLWEAHREARLLLIDMPIGLADGREPRACDALARELLKPGRASSIFAAPVREVVGAAGYAEANALQRQVSGRGLSRQSWGLVPKIRRLDELLQRDAEARGRFRESHPELCFAQLFGGPMCHGKKTPEGFAERLAHLRRVCAHADLIVGELLARYTRKALARDDMLDALVLAVTGCLSGGALRQVPAEGDADRTGLRRTISFYKPEERPFAAGGQGSI
ncbi:DUF429 domain-containing protein [Paenibacillus ehimensis]|uniref:DUF429 domain-containing protein n=2 Tax=Paenibacillus ehimensis TaxID=79264 RepID=UPI000A830E7F|nr:DUF429 domain-containing protein [Paenibacillus ehimensis]